MMKCIKLSEIKIPEEFIKNYPSPCKIERRRRYWNENHIQERYLVINKKNMLIDGYTQYLILIENGIEEAMYIRRNTWGNREKDNYKIKPTTYIYGVHSNSNCVKEFCWRVPTNWRNWADNIQRGDTIICQTKFGLSPVVVNKVEILDKPPVEMRVKKVAKREVKRGNFIIKF